MDCAYLVAFNFRLPLFLASFSSLLDFCHMSPFSILDLMSKLYTPFALILIDLQATLGGVFFSPTSDVGLL